VKKSVQNMVFPEGIWFDFKKSEYRTKQVNEVFSSISCLTKDLEANKNGTTSNLGSKSRSVEWNG
ncbi:hypothetical protein JYT51_01590, partial [Candidatus Amoebophilus asiaticus]|nr:hypothetical protein [Candidatus Amoebophilus asiaticus]